MPSIEVTPDSFVEHLYATVKRLARQGPINKPIASQIMQLIEVKSRLSQLELIIKVNQQHHNTYALAFSEIVSERLC